ncbi:MAG: hypothetical protein IJA20_08310 [Methanocorpusculum sp.]|nr:hypothetical protein [Oscillospiraceae bacterium]MBQ3570655.1 hypothetical protein [Methanocorpusculum sp.]
MNGFNRIGDRTMIYGFPDFLGKKVRIVEHKEGIAISLCEHDDDYGCVYLSEDVFSKPVVFEFLEKNNVFAAQFIKDTTGAYIQVPR